MSKYNGTITTSEFRDTIKKLDDQHQLTGLAHGDFSSSTGSSPDNILVETLPDESHKIHFIDYRGQSDYELQKDSNDLYNALFDFTPTGKALKNAGLTNTKVTTDPIISIPTPKPFWKFW